MSDQPKPIDDDLSGLSPEHLAALSGVSDTFAVARRLEAAIAARDTDAMAAIVVEIDTGPGPGLVALAAATEAVRFALSEPIPAERLVEVLQERAFRQIGLANHHQHG
jgi:hypothetical protein